MPRCNRVTPLGELIAVADRGLVFGNRGCLHGAGGEIRRGYRGRRWIACRLEFRGRRRTPLMAPGRYTELFFLDEATALASGHRPCAECRHADYERFRTLFADVHGEPSGADAIDARLHAERLDGVHRRLHERAFDELPDGTMVLCDGRAWLVLGPQLRCWQPGGYGAALRRPRRTSASVITPPTLVGLLESGWQPVVSLLHPSAAG